MPLDLVVGSGRFPTHLFKILRESRISVIGTGKGIHASLLWPILPVNIRKTRNLANRISKLQHRSIGGIQPD